MMPMPRCQAAHPSHFTPTVPAAAGIETDFIWVSKKVPSPQKDEMLRCGRKPIHVEWCKSDLYRIIRPVNDQDWRPRSRNLSRSIKSRRQQPKCSNPNAAQVEARKKSRLTCQTTSGQDGSDLAPGVSC